MLTQDFIVYAINVHTGGGKILLDALLQKNSHIQYLFCDQRYIVPSHFTGRVISVQPTLWSRVNAEFRLHQLIKKENLPTLFFGNLPPFFKKTTASYLFLQNAFLLKNIPIPFDSLKSFIRLTIEKWWLKRFINNIDTIFVQIPWMKKKAELSFNTKTSLWPLLPSFLKKEKVLLENRKYDLLFIGTLSKNKNLEICLNGLLNLDRDLNLNKKITFNCILNNENQKRILKLKQDYNFNHIQFNIITQISREEVLNLFTETKILITCSQYESFNLPLYEGLEYGCKVLAPLGSGYTEHLDHKDLIKLKNFESDLSQTVLKLI